MERSALQVLAEADAEPSLPLLGGMARPDGVVVLSERFWAFAGRDGTLREGLVRRPPRLLRRLPLVRGLVRLALALGPLFRRGGVARPRERVLLAAALAAPLAFALLPAATRLPAALALTALLVAWLVRGRTLRLHGGEHRAIAAAEEGQLVETWAGTAQPSRFAARCGTNFAALALPLAFAAQLLWPFGPAVLGQTVASLGALGLAMELWRVVQGSTRRTLRALLLPGLALQRLTTREPSLDDTRVALTAAASVLRRELALRRG
jgi:hypothetical protein